MKPEILALFTESLLNEAASRFGIATESINPLNGFENYVCECSYNDQPHILRLTHDSHRVAIEIEAELDWLDYLATHSVPVCRPLTSWQ